MRRLCAIWFCWLASIAQAAQPNAEVAPRKHFTLQAEDYWRLDVGGMAAFDASGLVFNNGDLLTVTDKGSSLYRIVFTTNHTAGLMRTPIFSAQQMQPLKVGPGDRFDCEGLARDESGRIYMSEEGRRRIFRWDPKSNAVEHLRIDWSPMKKYFSGDPNASFEGVAVGDGKLWVANERDAARIFELNLETLEIVADYAPQPSQPSLALHYSDLCYYKGRLFVLLRHSHVILEVEPKTREVLAEYDYETMEEAPEHRYQKFLPTGTMEGLAADDKYFWLVTDNNGFGRVAEPGDKRPTLFKCARPVEKN